jgi:dipeptidyl-peptidase-4
MVVSADSSVTSRNSGLVAVDEKNGWVYFTSNKDALPERHLYRVKLDGSGLRRLSAEAGIHVTTFSPTLGYYLDVHTSSSIPAGLTLRAPDGRLVQTIAPPVRDIYEQFGLGPREFHTYRTEDGIDLTLKIVKPVDFDPSRKYPTLIYIYGGPGSQAVRNDWPRNLWDDLLVQEGFIAVSVEIRAGQIKSKALETSIYRQAYGMQNVKDILAAVRWLGELPYNDTSRLGIWGGSGGGCTTLYTMTHCDAFKAGISLYPVSDWHFYDTIYTERYLDTPERNPRGYKETSSVLAARDLKGKLLIVHGTYDDNVHPQNTEAFIHELIAANMPFEMMIYPWQKHGIGARPDQIHLRTLMLDFWKRNL